MRHNGRLCAVNVQYSIFNACRLAPSTPRPSLSWSGHAGRDSWTPSRTLLANVRDVSGKHPRSHLTVSRPTRRHACTQI